MACGSEPVASSRDDDFVGSANPHPRAPPMSGLIRNPADRRQVAMAVAGPFVLLGPFLVSTNVFVEIGLWLVVWTILCRHNYILHNHVHCPFTRSKLLNRTLGTLLGFCTGMTVGNWKITHVHGHHVAHKLNGLPGRTYIDRLHIDETQPFSVRAGLWHALATAPIQWAAPIGTMVGGSFGKSTARRKFYRYHLAEFVLIYGIVAGLFLLNPLKALFYFGLIYYLVFIISRYIDYLTHAGGHDSSGYSIANVCLHPTYNKHFWNFGFHVAHHLRPTAHWTTLPTIHAALKVNADPTPTAVRPNVLGMFSPAAFRWHRVTT